MSVLATSSAHAVAPRPARRVIADELTAMPAAGVTRALRSQRQVRYAVQPTAAWQRFAAATGSTWRAAWDAATSVPHRLWGPGLAAPGANGSPAIAERFARQLLADHLELLAPGAAIADFVLVSNHSDGDIRSVGFLQLSGGRRVIGGQLSFRFKRDRMFVIGSEALPNVVVATPRARLAPGNLHARARDGLRRALDLPGGEVTAPGDEVILPLVGDDAVLGYRLATPMTIDGGAEGRYLAYVDPASGDVLAVHQQNRYATGQLHYRSVDRHPGRARLDRVARSARVVVAGAAQTTTPTGGLTWSPDVAVTIATAVLGDQVTVFNKDSADMMLATSQLMLSPGGTAIWDASANEKADAQVQVFIATNRVKDFVRTNLDAGMVGLDVPTIANVNIAQNCNAFFDGKSINFFHANTQCQNTGLLEDVVFHEYGHAVHAAEIIEGVGSFDGAMSEGAADFLAAIITNDSGMGRGFFHTDEPLREIDPVNSEYTWPKDIREIHHTGMIYGGTFWDLRKALLADRPEAEALALVHKLFVATLRRSVSIPSSMIEALAADDDDGDLTNGTPNECFIRDAYGRHGLRTATGTVAAPGALTANAQTTVVRVDLSGLSPRCGGDEIQEVTLNWKPGYTNVPAPGSKTMTAVNPNRYWASLPLATDDVTYYSAQVKFMDGSTLTLADNLADPNYTVYQGTTVPLYCTSFDTDPFAEGWTTGAETGVSPWAWGAPIGGGTDPPAPFTGSRILGQNLAGDYLPGLSTYVRLPDIDVGLWSDVHLQYRRWLAVEDSHFDQARVMVNGQRAWINFNSNMGDSSSIHHIDREWRFHDVQVSGYAFGHTLSIGFELQTDEGLQLGGWQLDDLCVVANVKSVCGDGVKSPTEQCDDGAGNENAPGMCRTYCKLPACGDRIVDSNEVCDDGLEGSETCTATCEDVEIPTLGGCCSSTRGAGGAIALGALVGALLVLPRRRRRARA